jgi:hypothetical protein
VTHKTTVLARQLFYNNSSYDRANVAANADDDAAIAPDKAALLPGQTVAFRNYSTYSKGINGIILDMKDLPAGGTLGVGDFVFKIGSGDPAGWQNAPTPTAIVIRRGAGVGGSDRVTITFADRAILNQWLQVTVKATANTNLAAPDVFYFGSLVGDTGDATTPLRVSPIDFINIRRAATGGPAATLTNAYDLNRDGRVNALDLVVLRSSLNHFLRGFTAPASPAPAPVPAPGAPAPAPAALGTVRVWDEPTVDPLGRAQ